MSFYTLETTTAETKAVAITTEQDNIICFQEKQQQIKQGTATSNAIEPTKATAKAN